MQPFWIATGNLGKFREIRAGLEGLPYEFFSLADWPGLSDQVEESGATHSENALLKAQYLFNQIDSKFPRAMTLGEDSGLVTEALKGELGLNTRRWGAGVSASDKEWLDFFLKRMEPFGEYERNAYFICAVALILSDGTTHFFEGKAKGRITHHPEALILPGLPLSSVFMPEGCDRVYAALSPSEKAKVSHRGLAMSKVRRFLEASEVS